MNKNRTLLKFLKSKQKKNVCTSHWQDLDQMCALWIVCDSEIIGLNLVTMNQRSVCVDSSRSNGASELNSAKDLHVTVVFSLLSNCCSSAARPLRMALSLVTLRLVSESLHPSLPSERARTNGAFVQKIHHESCHWQAHPGHPIFSKCFKSTHPSISCKY